MGALIVLAIFLIGYGLVALFLRDAVWALTKFGNSWEGQKSERSDVWEAKTVFSGVVMIIIGIGILVWALGQ